MSTEREKALRFVVGLGIVSLFADFVYEGGRSIVGPYLATLGASSLFVGLVAGLGEFLGYAIRLGTGRYVDKSHRHWLVMGLGYTVNMFAVPLLALASSQWSAGLLVFTERMGKGARAPARDALLSHAGHELGHGKAFGLHEFLDQLGAVLGPLVVAAAVAWSGYRLGFAVLTLPALLALFFLWRARGLDAGEGSQDKDKVPGRLDRRYGLYLIFSMLSVMGFAHFILVAYHLEHMHRLAPALIPLLFGLAMGVDALAALAAGWLFDRHGLKVLMVMPLFTLPAVPLLFLGDSPALVWLGAACWGAALGVQESTVRAGVATITPQTLRGTAYGLFDACFGLAWLLGSVILGAVYAEGTLAVTLTAIAFQLAALPALFLLLGMRSAQA
ncbi:MAG TPA: MFS transporter [Gammaproteobacteria bacterium]|nr:MFS transporter [Gammaproteobacteria bacterium]